MQGVFRSFLRCGVVLLALAVGSCVPPTPGSGPGPSSTPPPPPVRPSVGNMQVDAPGVYVNGNPVLGSVQLFDGDDVRTDGSGWATIFFSVGGSVRLRPNSDPVLRFIDEAGCLGRQLVTYLQYGVFDFRDVVNVCFCDRANQVCGAPQSDFRVAINQAGASVTVSQGSVVVSVGYPRPYRRFPVAQGAGIVVRRGQTEGPRPILR